MSRFIQAAWLLPCFVLFLLLGRDLIVEALNRGGREGQSWVDRCDCDVCAVTADA